MISAAIHTKYLPMDDNSNGQSLWDVCVVGRKLTCWTHLFLRVAIDTQLLQGHRFPREPLVPGTAGTPRHSGGHGARKAVLLHGQRWRGHGTPGGIQSQEAVVRLRQTWIK